MRKTWRMGGIEPFSSLEETIIVGQSGYVIIAYSIPIR